MGSQAGVVRGQFFRRKFSTFSISLLRWPAFDLSIRSPFSIILGNIRRLRLRRFRKSIMSKDPLHDWESKAAWVRSLVRGMVQDEHLAEDIAQDALAAGLGADTGAVANPRAWLAGVVRNQARQRWREQRRRREREVRKGESSRAEVEAAAEVVAREEIHQKVAEEVRSLPDPFRTTLLLHYFEEHSVRRIAAHLGIPAKTVYSRLDAGRKMLHQRLRGRFGENWVVLVLPLAAPTGKGLALASTSISSHATSMIAVAAFLAVAAILAWSPSHGSLFRDASSVTDGAVTADANTEMTAVLPLPSATRTEIASNGTENQLEVRFEGFGDKVDFYWIRSDDWGSWKLNAAKLAVTFQDAIRAYGQQARADSQGRAWLPDGQRLELLVVTDHGISR
jgi:RNA polymerase sigma-70 factor (ECF subfamily)